MQHLFYFTEILLKFFTNLVNGLITCQLAHIYSGFVFLNFQKTFIVKCCNPKDDNISCPKLKYWNRVKGTKGV